VKKIRYILFVIILFELLLGGGGRLTAWGPISLRMILFGCAIMSSVFFILKGEKLSSAYWTFLFLFMLMLGVGVLMGIVSGSNRALWWEDVKPLLYVLILPFFLFTISSLREVEFVGRAVKISSLIIASSFVLVLLLIHTSIIPFLTFYHTVIQTQELFFRGEFTFFYKGFLFLSIGLLFFHFIKPEKKTWILLFLSGAIILSVTRGLMLGLCLTFASYYFYKSSAPKAFLFVGLSLGIIFGGQYAIGQSSDFINGLRSTKKTASHAVLFGDREYSDEGRWQQIKEVTSAITPLSFLIGHGFGHGIPSRLVHMEISYLEILHKQGVIGLFVWGYLLWMLFIRWKNGSASNFKDAFFFSSLFIFFQSLTNQYINNPIGLSWLLISLVCLDRLNSAQEFKL
jgi:hypothetical protein